ncbi:MAG: ribosome-associated translation inhibitor RaiA [Candidatus Cloacimonadota bacterium]|nr:ribosome-associated translation inhibitor RaiA [Candidatus Cloacimonadota bacterium]
MKTTITARHFELTDALRKHVEDGINSLKRYSDNIIFAEVVLWNEKNLHFAEVNLKVRRLNVFSKSKKDDMYKAIDDAVEKAEIQIKKHFNKINGRHTKPKTNVENLAYTQPQHEEKVDRKEVILSSMAVDYAISELALSDEKFILFRNKANNKINLLQKNENELELLEIQ